MTAAGWYKAQGDPVGTHRYWDGTQWVGDPIRADSAKDLGTAGGFDLIAPADDTFTQSYGAFDVVSVAEPPTPTAPTPESTTPVGLTFLPGLKFLAVIVSISKMIPLVLAALLLSWLADKGRDLDRALGSNNAESIRDSETTVYGVLAVFAGLLVIQIVAALREKPLVLFGIALVLSLLDLVSLVRQATSGSALLILLLSLIVTAAQIGTTAWAWTVYRSRS